MTNTPFPHAAKYGPQDLRKWNPALQQLVNPTAVYVYAVGTTTRSTLYSDANRTTTVPNNPVANGVAANSPGVDGVGNLIFYAEHNDYDVVADGYRLTVRTQLQTTDVSASVSPSVTPGVTGGFDPSTYVNW